MKNGSSYNIEFRVPREFRYVALIRKGIRHSAKQDGYTERECDDIEVAVGEAVTNAIAYSRVEGCNEQIYVNCNFSPNRLVVDVQDGGCISCVPDPLPNPNIVSEHGRGWLLIHRLMDSVSIRCTDDGMTVRMVKEKSHLNQPQRTPVISEK